MLEAFGTELAVEFVPEKPHGLLFVDASVLSVNETHKLYYTILLEPSETKQYAAQIARLKRLKRVPKEVLKLVKQRLRSTLEEEATVTLLSMKSSERTQSTLVAGSRTDVLCLAEIEGRSPDLADIERWEARRDLRLPWLSELTTEQIIRLRQEAKLVLPRLRELLRNRLEEAGEENENRVRNLLAELRSQAVEVENELRGLGLQKKDRHRTAMGGACVQLGSVRPYQWSSRSRRYRCGRSACYSSSSPYWGAGIREGTL